MKHFLLISVFFLTLSFNAEAQLLGFGTYWNDAFHEWVSYSEEDEGYLKQRWFNTDNFKEWDYGHGDHSGSIIQKWKNDPTLWEVQAFGGETITMRTLYPNDLNQWRITNNNSTIELRMKWSNDFNEWEIRRSNHGSWKMYTDWTNDPREWIIEDGLQDLSFDFKMGIVFLVIYHSAVLPNLR